MEKRNSRVTSKGDPLRDGDVAAYEPARMEETMIMGGCLNDLSSKDEYNPHRV